MELDLYSMVMGFTIGAAAVIVIIGIFLCAEWIKHDKHGHF